jgi:lactoylglutathione lyase
VVKTPEISHLAAYVDDLPQARDFFVRYFDAVPSALYENPKTGFSSYFLSFGGEVRLELMHKEGLKKSHGATRGYDHLCFALASKEAVDALSERLRRDGYPVLTGPRLTGDGYYESLIEGIEGLSIELTA